jgi:hypothetical protein
MNAAHTPTPRTDGEWNRLAGLGHPEFERCLSHFARQLERELAEAKDRIDDLTSTGIHSCHAECGRPNCVLRREIAEATKQRDALAVALRALMFDSLRFRIEPSDDAYKNAESSLAALEGRGSSPAQKSPPTTP